MSYLAREAASLSAELWDKIDDAVVKSASAALIGRRFLHLYGPLGIGTTSIQINEADKVEEVADDGLMVTMGRKFVEIPTLYSDFTLAAKDLEAAARLGYPADLSRAAHAAQLCARKEDELIFFGSKANGYEGLLTAQGVNTMILSDWKTGENAFSDVAAALALFTTKGIYGPYALVVSPDVYTALQRIQPGTGVLELDRIKSMLSGNVFMSPALGAGKAVMVANSAMNMDLVVGQDMAAAYLEQKDLNHVFRILETALLRIKNKQAVIVFE